MICEKCGKENSNEMKFCGYCGHNLTGDIQCSKCNNWVSSEFNYCPICSKPLKNKIGKVKEEDEFYEIKKKIRQDNISKIFSPKLTHMMMIILSIGMILVFLGSLSKVNINYRYEITYANHSNVVDYVEAGIKGFSDYTYQEYIKEIQDIQKNRSDNKDIIENIKVLNSYMVDVDNFHINKIMIYVNILFIFASVVLSLTLIGVSIYEIKNSIYTNKHKKLLLANLIIGFILNMTVSLMGHKVGIGLIFLLILTGIGLLYSYFEAGIKERKIQNMKGFLLRGASILILALLTFLSTTNIARISLDDGYAPGIEKDMNLGQFTLVLNHLEGHSTPYINFNETYSYIVSNEGFKDLHGWVMYVSLIIPVLVIMSFTIFLVTLIFEIKENGKYIKTPLYAWVAFFSQILVIILTILIVIPFNDYARDHQTIYGLKLAPGIIIFSLLTLGYAIYKSVIKKKDLI